MSTYSKLLLERAARAFIAAATAAMAAGAATTNFSVPSVKALLVGAGAAGVSAVMTLLSRQFGDPGSTSFTGVTVDK